MKSLLFLVLLSCALSFGQQVPPQRLPVLPAQPDAVRAIAACPALVRFQHAVVKDASGKFHIEFRPDMAEVQSLGLGDLEWVDVHYFIKPIGAVADLSSASFTSNFRMMKNEAGVFLHQGLEALGITLNEGEKLYYFFTYCIGGVLDCDTEVFTHELGAPLPIEQPIAAATAPAVALQCPALTRFSHSVTPMGSGLHKISFIPDAAELASIGLDLTFVDVHLSINGGCDQPQLNYRMNKLSAQLFEHSGEAQGIMLSGGDVLSYFFTYCLGNGVIDCDTQCFTFSAAQGAVAPVEGEQAIGGVTGVAGMTGMTGMALTGAAAAVAAEGDVGGPCPAFDFSFLLTLMPGQTAPSATTPSFFMMKFFPQIRDHPVNINWVELHMVVNEQGEGVNVRMQKLDGNLFESRGENLSQGFQLRTGDRLRFFFTYQLDEQSTCNTQSYTLTI